MRNTLRTLVVGLMVLALSFNPAAACRFFHGHGGGYYSYGPVYDGCGGCDSCETVVYDDCGGCDSCDGVVTEKSEADTLHEPAPAAPAETPPLQPEQPATVDRPVETTPAPDVPTEPVPSEPTPPAEDLFNGTEETVTPPATETPAETPAEEPADLFGTPTEEPAEATPPAESSAPAETPATEEPAVDLFDSAPAETEEMPAETETAPAETPADETPAEESDDIFGTSSGILREAGGLASSEMRVWVDNTGNYSCRGRLVRFLDGQVRLLKDNDRTTTVPLYRLSAGDLEFVNRQANAKKAEAFQTAQSLSAMPHLAN